MQENTRLNKPIWIFDRHIVTAAEAAYTRLFATYNRYGRYYLNNLTPEYNGEQQIWKIYHVSIAHGNSSGLLYQGSKVAIHAPIMQLSTYDCSIDEHIQDVTEPYSKWGCPAGIVTNGISWSIPGNALTDQDIVEFKCLYKVCDVNEI